MAGFLRRHRIVKDLSTAAMSVCNLAGYIRPHHMANDLGTAAMWVCQCDGYIRRDYIVNDLGAVVRSCAVLVPGVSAKVLNKERTHSDQVPVKRILLKNYLSA